MPGGYTDCELSLLTRGLTGSCWLATALSIFSRGATNDKSSNPLQRSTETIKRTRNNVADCREQTYNRGHNATCHEI